MGGGGSVNAMTKTPPGLPLPATHLYGNSNEYDGNGTATFLLPLQDYTPYANQAFREANELAERLLPGSHPVRLSVKVEYAAYVYDCLHEAEASRRLAKLSIRHVYEAQEGMDDDSFEDAAEMVGILGRMMNRGSGGGGGGGSSGGNGTGNVTPGSKQATARDRTVTSPGRSRQKKQQQQYEDEPPTTWV
jgi:hypothetical protein